MALLHWWPTVLPNMWKFRLRSSRTLNKPRKIKWSTKCRWSLSLKHQNLRPKLLLRYQRLQILPFVILLLRYHYTRSFLHCQGVGKAVYKAEEGGIIWRIKKFPGKTEASLRASVELLSAQTTSITSTNNGKQVAWDRPPITMRFALHNVAASGLHIRYLRVTEKSGYRPYKVR